MIIISDTAPKVHLVMLRSKQFTILFIFCLTFSHCSNSEEAEKHNDVDMQLDHAMQSGMTMTDEDSSVQDAQHSDQVDNPSDQISSN